MIFLRKMSSNSDLVKQVHLLIEAENKHNREMAEAILAQNFTAITRAKKKDQEKQEQGRDALLGKIAEEMNSQNNIERKLDEHDFSVWESGDIGVVRSLVMTINPKDPEVILGRFRNIHVFQKQQGQWRCVAWQVTKLE
jgi:ketosteroid isomerase-like protein